MAPSIALLTENTLIGLGLKSLLTEFLPTIEIAIFNSYEEFERQGTERHVHYFVDRDLFLRHMDFFMAHQHKTILLGKDGNNSFGQFHQIDCSESEERLVHEILSLRQGAHRPEHHIEPPKTEEKNPLSAREVEVLTLLARGMINKEIADTLHIGLTTVITHRRNIMEKTAIKTLAGLTLYAASKGYVDLDEF